MPCAIILSVHLHAKFRAMPNPRQRYSRTASTCNIELLPVANKAMYVWIVTFVLPLQKLMSISGTESLGWALCSALSTPALQASVWDK